MENIHNCSVVIIGAEGFEGHFLLFFMFSVSHFVEIDICQTLIPLVLGFHGFFDFVYFLTSIFGFDGIVDFTDFFN